MNAIGKAVTASVLLLLPVGASGAEVITGDLQVTGIISNGVAGDVMAEGSTLATAKLLAFETNRIGTVAAGTGVRLPAGSGLAANLATTIEVWNAGANDLRVYPASTDQFHGTAAAGVPLMVGPGERMRFLYTGAGTIWSAARDSLVFGPNSLAAAPGTAVFQAANDAGYPRLLTVLPGTYNLAEPVYSYAQNAWQFLRGTKFQGEGRIDAVTDGGAVNSSAVSLARLLTAPGNEHVLFVSALLGKTEGGSYEKSGVYSRIITTDPSQGVNRDAVAFEGQVGIESPNKFGRAWGINTAAGPLPPPSSTADRPDGYAVGGEFTTTSYSGSDAGTLGTPTSKIAVHAVAYGENTSTAGIVLSGSGTTFLDGIVAQQQALSPGGHAFSVRPISLPPNVPKTRADDVAYITREGGALFQDTRIGALGINGNMASGMTFPSFSASAGRYVGGIMGWNYFNGGGAAEVDFINNYLGPAASFVWLQRTGTGSTSTAHLMTLTPTANLRLAGSNIVLSTPHTPIGSSSSCETGALSWDSSYLYMCVATNTWKRSSLSSW